MFDLRDRQPVPVILQLLIAFILFLLNGFGLIYFPDWLFGGSIIESPYYFAEGVDAGELYIPPPNDTVSYQTY